MLDTKAEVITRLRGMLKGSIEEWEGKRAWDIERKAHALVGYAQGRIDAYRLVLDLLDQMEGEKVRKRRKEKDEPTLR